MYATPSLLQHLCIQAGMLWFSWMQSQLGEKLCCGPQWVMAPGSTELMAILCLEGSKNTTAWGFFSALVLFRVIYQ